MPTPQPTPAPSGCSLVHGSNIRIVSPDGSGGWAVDDNNIGIISSTDKLMAVSLNSKPNEVVISDTRLKTYTYFQVVSGWMHNTATTKRAQTFTCAEVDGGFVTWRAPDGTYVTADNGKLATGPLNGAPTINQKWIVTKW
ncbi:Aste57867_7280 [Aphanomyces stellatus]|uniref:Aste57867_7280 protein n=1 Tax=Aphanomyces stellatus TaxID=120398 RepID=A0A485KI31_9STRA|nr:hypothetical protein As57867_007255 [Aphanomyces stellatus]VFT84201.1 Aste57867_7280 [Aphanomyces stellatus]